MLTEKLMDYWRASNLQVAPPATPLQIERFEAFNHVVLPDDFRAYISHANGFFGKDSDTSMISFWPLEDMKPVSDKNTTSTYFAFADFLIDSHYYAIKLLPTQDSDIGSIWAVCHD